MRLFVPTASKDVVAMTQSLLFLLCSSGLCVTNSIVWTVYLLSVNVVTGCNKQTYICHPLLLKGPSYSSGLRFTPQTLGWVYITVVLQRQLVSSKSAFHCQYECWHKMSRPTRGCSCCRPAKYLNWLFTLIMTKLECQATSVQLREVLKLCQGYNNLNCSTKQPAVMSPAVQIHPVPLMKRLPVRVGQVNRFNRQ